MGGPGVEVVLPEPLTAAQRLDLAAWLRSVAVEVWIRRFYFRAIPGQAGEFAFKAAALAADGSSAVPGEAEAALEAAWRDPSLIDGLSVRNSRKVGIPRKRRRPVGFYFGIGRAVNPAEDPERREHFSPEEVVRFDYEHGQWLERVGFWPLEEIGLLAYCNQPIDHRALAGVALTLARRYAGWLHLRGEVSPPPQAGRINPPDGGPYWSTEEIHTYVTNVLPGKVAEIKSLDWKCPVDHVLDPVAFAAWMNEPHFYLIK
jgi:hypothetical protein